MGFDPIFGIKVLVLCVTEWSQVSVHLDAFREFGEGNDHEFINPGIMGN